MFVLLGLGSKSEARQIIILQMWRRGVGGRKREDEEKEEKKTA